MAVDKWGIKKFYPTKSGGLEWFSNWNRTRTLRSNEFDPYDSRVGVMCGDKTDNGLFIGDGKARFKGFDESPRIYVKGPWLNTEQTVYIKILPQGEATSIQLRSRSNHSGPNRLPYPDMGVDQEGNTSISCGWGNYVVLWGMTALNICDVQVELMHGFYKRHLVDKPFIIPKGQLIGYKMITRNIENNTKVKVEGWNNMARYDQSDWKKTVEFTFDGSNAPVDQSVLDDQPEYLRWCLNRGDKLTADLNSHQIWNNPSYWNWIRINNVKNTELKYYSVREIV
jgi:hypothetical protein